MSRATDREASRLWGGTAEPSRQISDGLTYGRRSVHEIFASSDEEEALKRGMIEDAAPRSIAAGLTYGDPRDDAVQHEQERQRLIRAHQFTEQEERDRAELALRRELDQMAEAAYTINEAGGYGWTNPELNAQAAGYWQALTTEQRARLVAEGEVDELMADHLHGAVWPAVAQAEVEQNAEATRVAGNMQKATFLLQHRAELGNPDDAAWHEHQRQVFARAREQGINLADDAMGSQAFEDQFRAAEVVLAEDARAEAVAKFQIDLLNTETTNVSEGLRVLTAGGWESTIEGGPVEVKPDYARAAARVLGGGNGDPMHDDADAIRAGILGATTPTEDREWRQTQEAAGKLFSDAEEARIKAKLGER